jgi:c-di-GMP-binding flagellar brake protein YcgR
MKSTLDYLVEISPEQNEKLLKSIINYRQSIQVKIAEIETIFSTLLEKAENKSQLILINKTPQLLNRQATFKVTINDEVYFFKSKIEAHGKLAVTMRPEHIFKLIRRREPRHRIPTAWPQSVLILASEKININTPAHIIELSTSGLKLQSAADLPRFEKDQKIRLQFKIYKRGGITATGIIRHIRRNRTGGSTIGVEFITTNALTEMKIQNVCDDLTYFYAHRARLLT